MRNFLFNDENNITSSDSLQNGINNESDSNLLSDILSSDNTEILLFIIIFLLLFTSFGRR